MDSRADGGWKPATKRDRVITRALASYAALTRSAAFGAVRDAAVLDD